MPTFMMSLNWTDQGIRGLRIRPSAQKLRAILPKRWASRLSIFISPLAKGISSFSSMRRVAKMLPSSR